MLPGLDVRDAPSPVKPLPYYTGREATTVARGYLVLCSRFPVRLTRDPLHTGSPLVSLLPASTATAAAASGATGVPNERRSSTTRTVGPSALAHLPIRRVIRMRISARARLRREPTDTAVIHLAAGFRDSLTFLRIGPFADASLRRCGPAGCTWPQLLWQTGRYPVDCRWSFVSTDKKLLDVHA